MYLKISEREGRKIVAACDKELLGEVFEEGGVVLDLDTYASFYKGEEVGAEELGKALRDFDSANLVGKECVAVALKNGLAKEGDIRYIKDIPHVQLYKI